MTHPFKSFRIIAAFLFSASLTLTPVFAQPALVSNPGIEERVKTLSSELRCLVCQNQTVADSDSMVARDMREQVRTQVRLGKSDAEIKRYMTDRFGDFVLYKPPFKTSTILLWYGPFLLLFVGAALLVRTLQKRNKTEVQHSALDEISGEDRARAKALLNRSADGTL